MHRQQIAIGTGWRNLAIFPEHASHIGQRHLGIGSQHRRERLLQLGQNRRSSSTELAIAQQGRPRAQHRSRIVRGLRLRKFNGQNAPFKIVTTPAETDRPKLPHGSGRGNPPLRNAHHRQAQCRLGALPALCRSTDLLELSAGMAEIGLPQIGTAPQDVGFTVGRLPFQPMQSL
ncbi:hypothetical protein D9M73_153840 [compost metagenome]